MYEDRSVWHYFNYILLYYWCCSVGFPVKFGLNSNEFQGLGASFIQPEQLASISCSVWSSLWHRETKPLQWMHLCMNDVDEGCLATFIFIIHTRVNSTPLNFPFITLNERPPFFLLDIMKSSSVYNQLGNRKVCDNLRADSTVCVSITKCSNMSGCYQPLFINGVHSTNTQIWSN